MAGTTRRAFLCGLAVIGCHPAKSAMPRSGIDITYALDYPRHASLELRLPPNARAELWLHQPLTPGRPDPIGRFAASLPRELRDELDRYVLEHGLLDDSFTGEPSAEGSGHIRLSGDGHDALYGLNGADDVVTTLAQRLQSVVERVAKSPVAALRLSLQLDSDPSAARVTAILEHVGDEPLAVLLYDPQRTDMGLAISASLETGDGRRQDVGTKPRGKSVVQLGLPSYPNPIPVRARYAIPLPDARAPEGFARVTAMATFHRPGPGKALHGMLLYAEPVDAPARGSVELRSHARSGSRE